MNLFWYLLGDFGILEVRPVTSPASFAAEICNGTLRRGSPPHITEAVMILLVGVLLQPILNVCTEMFFTL